jgi:predicted membrane chloride channel (bestrophin family)
MVLTTPESIIEQASTQSLLDDLIDESVRTSARRPIMMQFDPSRVLIWKRWKGTVFSEVWRQCLRNMAIACVILLIAQLVPNLKDSLSGFSILWGQLLSVTTFTLTFFLNQSYALWRKCYELSRRLQGRLNDLGLFLASHASRKTPTNPKEPSTYTPGSRQLLELIARYIRLFNLLTYASFTRSHRPILTPRGMRRMVERGLLTPQERQVLVDAEVPATQRHNAVIMWIMRLFIEGRAAGHLQGGSGYEQQFLEKCHVIRSQYGAIGDELQGRMPLAYVHIVQVLVDVILWLYPLMAFSINMSPILGILGTGLLTMTYQGLFDLAKQFLDPYDNENYGKGEDPLCVDTLVAETNSGSVRWLSGFNEMPFSSQRIIDGELFDYQLPIRGYSVEELEQMEEEKRQLQEKKEREALELLKAAEEEQLQSLQGTPSDKTSSTNPLSTIFRSMFGTDEGVVEEIHINGEDRIEVMDSVVSEADGSSGVALVRPHNATSALSSSTIVSHPDGGENEQAEVVAVPLTFEDYTKRVEELKEAAEEEFLETQAILNAAPGADIPHPAEIKVAVAQERQERARLAEEVALDVLGLHDEVNEDVESNLKTLHSLATNSEDVASRYLEYSESSGSDNSTAA